MSPEAHFWIGIIPGLWDRKRRDQRWHIEGTHDAQVVAGKDIKALFGDVLTSVCSWEMNLKDGVVWGYHILLVVIADAVTLMGRVATS